MRCRRAGITGAGEPGGGGRQGSQMCSVSQGRTQWSEAGTAGRCWLAGVSQGVSRGVWGVADRMRASQPSAFLRYRCSVQHRAAAAQIAGRAAVLRQTVMTRCSDGARARSVRACLPVCVVWSLPAVHAHGPEAGAALWHTRAGRHGGRRAPRAPAPWSVSLCPAGGLWTRGSSARPPAAPPNSKPLSPPRAMTQKTIYEH